MPKFKTFGIFEKSIRELIEEIIASEAIHITKEALTDFIYEQGIDAFCSGEFIAISDDLIPYLKKEREYPPCFAAQVLGNKFKGLNAMRAKLLLEFPQAIAATGDNLEDIYDAFMLDTIERNDDFYQIEAWVRTGLREHAKKNPGDIIAVSNFNDYFLSEYKRILAGCADPVLKEKIQAHIHFIKELTQLDLYTTKQKSLTPASLTSRSSLAPSPRLSTLAASENARSKSSDAKPSTISTTLFGSLRKKTTPQEAPLLDTPRAQSV
jgi:hypothetical protein